MRIPAIFQALPLSMPSAVAQTSAVITGKTLKLHLAYATNPDCSSVGEVVIRVTSPPGNGRRATISWFVEIEEDHARGGSSLVQ